MYHSSDSVSRYGDFKRRLNCKIRSISVTAFQFSLLLTLVHSIRHSVG